MSYIQKYIEEIPESRIAFIDKRSIYSYAKLKNLKLQNKQILEILVGSSVVINGRDRLEFAILLSIMDGIVGKILFLPQDIEKSLHQKYYTEAHIQYEVFLENDMLKYVVVDKDLSIKNKEQMMVSTEWIIPTSGTTNNPKLVSHTFESLTKTTKLNIAIGELYRWGLVFDIYRFSGIQVLLQSILSGSTLIITDSSQNISQIVSFLVENRCNALSATPSFWRKVLMTKEANDLEFKRITLGGEISDENILKVLKRKYSESKISHIYASTEVGVGFSVTDCMAGFPTSYLDGKLKDIKMKISSDGTLWIAPNNKGQKYLSDDKIYDNEGYINTGDLVEIKNNRVYFLGRDSGAINVGGNKVQPEEIEQVLLSMDLISAAYVYAINNPMMGSLVCADIVLTKKIHDKKDVKMNIIRYCRDSLENFKVPAIIKFVNELQTTQSGKLKRNKK